MVLTFIIIFFYFKMKIMHYLSILNEKKMNITLQIYTM